MDRFIMGWIYVFQGIVAIITFGIFAPNWALRFYTYTLKRKFYFNFMKGIN